MSRSPKPVSELDVRDLADSPVWEFVLDDDGGGETAVRSVQQTPVDTLSNRLVGAQVWLHNGMSKWAVLSNLTLRESRRTQHFRTLWIENDGEWFEMARYFDVDYERRGPHQLAAFLGLRVDEVFPISYDISHIAVGSPGVLRAEIEARPPERLTEDELIDLALGE